MKVALVHDFLLKLGGAERVLKVLSEMYPSAPIYTLLYDENKVGHVFDKTRLRGSPLQSFPEFLRNRYRYFFPWMPQWIESFDLSGYDVVISSSSAYSHGVLTNSSTRHLCYSHSPMRYAWDWTHEYMEEQGVSSFKKWVASRLIHNVRLWDYYAIDRVDQYIANSENVRRRIQKYYHRESEVLYPPVDLERFTLHPGHENYFLIVSTLTPYKKIDRAIELFNKIRKRLVIIGEGSDRPRLERLAGPHIDFLGFKPDEVVRDYVQNCRALIFPGEEDFGITPVEAMACGKPVLAYGKGGALESMVAGTTGEFFDEPTVEAMEDALARLLAHETRYEPKRIRQHAERFHRDRFVEGMEAIVRKAASD